MRITGGAACCVVTASGGYPGKYTTGYPITGVAEAGEVALVFHAGTAERNRNLETAGGRVLWVVGQGANLDDARKRAYEAIGKITFTNSYHRTDIAATDPERILA